LGDQFRRNVGPASVMLPHQRQDVICHAFLRRQVELAGGIGQDRPQSKLALGGDQVREDRFLLGLEEQDVGGLVLGSDPDRGVAGEVRVALQQHRLATRGFDAVEKLLLYFTEIQRKRPLQYFSA